MKSLLILSIISCAVLAQTLTIDQQVRLKTYNHKPSLKNTVKKRMKSMAKITQDEAYLIARTKCQEGEITLNLNHYKQYLFYEIKNNTCNLKINALDGSLITKEF